MMNVDDETKHLFSEMEQQYGSSTTANDNSSCGGGTKMKNATMERQQRNPNLKKGRVLSWMLSVALLIAAFFPMALRFRNFGGAATTTTTAAGLVNDQDGGPTIGNYFSQEGPVVHLKLGDNSANWGTYNIGPTGTGNIPFNSDCSESWCVFNIEDDEQHYYGTITLGSVCDSVWFKQYEPACDDGSCYHIEDFSHTSSGPYYISFNGKPKIPNGPFPNVPPATPAVHTGTNNPIVLSVEGDNIMMSTSGGSTIPIRLKGLARESLEWNPQGQGLSPTDIARMKSWGANVIRIDMNQEFWLASDSATSTGSYKQIIDAIIHECISHNMAIILDLHWCSNGQTPMADRKSIDFWQNVATTYKSFGTVMFELYNEPNRITKDVWLNGDSDHAGMQELYNAVRGVGAQNIVLVGGLGWAYKLDFVNANFGVKGTNVVYVSHPYDTKGVVDTDDQPAFARNFAGIKGNHPIMFTEFGDNQRADFPPSSNTWEGVYDTYLKYINDNGIHYTAFTWFAGETAKPWDPVLISNWDGTPQYGGVKVKADLEAHPGTRIA